MEKIIKELISDSKSIAIFFHISPDGDAIGSSVALKRVLEQLGKKVTIFSEDIVPEYLEFLGKENVCYDIVKEKFDLGFVLDCPESKRIGKMEKVLNNCSKTINIDHHLSNGTFTTAKITNSKASSTCELIYFLLKDLKVEITNEIALALYTGLATDSGCFMFNITDNLHLIVNELAKKIKNIEDVNYKLFREKPVNEVKLYGEAINKLEILLNHRLAITNVTLNDFEKVNASLESTPGLIFMLSGLKDVDIICVMSEEKRNTYKVSFRSKTTDVCSFAKMFGGGGHKFAAGCKIYGSRNSVKQTIIEKAREYLCMV